LAADLAGLGVARANLIDAGQFRNPTLQTLFPIGAKPFELTLSLPIEQFLLRPSRVKAARAQWEVAAESLIQNGLNMARDARLGHASLVQAQARSATAREAAEVRAAIGRITDARLRAGDISASESKSAAADAEAAADAARQAQHDVIIAQDRLRVLLGLAPGIALEAQATAVDTQVPPPVDDLRTRAWSERPDLRAAELSVAAAAARAKWERSRLLTLGGVLSTKDVGSSGVRSGPGVSLDLPIFRSNAGPVSRADAEVEQAARQYIALRQRVDFEVSEARESLVRALDSLASWRDRVLPALRDVTADTRRAYEAGNVPYLTVLEFTRQSVDAALREIDLQAAARKAAADLDRSVGVRVARGK
jgi:cobalt-zinc-cadmium efflux system outer membrane protein